MSQDHYFIEGERIYLRGVQLSDVNETYHRWMNDPEVTHYLESRFFPLSLEQLRDYVSSKQGDSNNIFLAIIVRESDRHIGNIKLGPIDWIHRTGDIGLMIGEKDCWGKGYATQAISLVMNYAFITLNLHKLTASCYDSNKGSAKAFQKVGFEVEGVRKQHFYCDGKYEDLVLMGILNRSWRAAELNPKD
jgi:RimJ/RimL family protein N-acetyltransferase